MIKGPKAILSSAIANALEEYFIVDASTIESNLLSDAKIVLRNVQLKEQTTIIPINSAGKSTKITITGCVESVTFSWSWSVGDVMWVNDSMLTIDGAKFEANLEHIERIKEKDDTSKTNEEEEEENIDRREAFVNPDTIDQTSARKIKEQKDGLNGFVSNQVKMIIDSLTLRLINFELRIVLPQNQQVQEVEVADSNNIGISATNSCNRVLVVSGDKIEVLSFGRKNNEKKEQLDDTTPTKLKQRINLSQFSCNINLEGKYDQKVIISYPLLEPLSYSAETLRIGERFGGFMRGLEVNGLGEPTESSPDLVSLIGNGLTVHLSNVQLEYLMQLSVMILAPPDDDNSTTSSDEKESAEYSDDEGTQIEISSFTFPLVSASLVLFDDMRISFSGITGRYRADGTVCSIQAGNMEFDSDTKGKASASVVQISMRPKMEMTIGCIDTLHFDTLLLATPIEDCKLSYEGNTLVMRLETIDVVTFSKKEGEDGNQSDAIVSPLYLPCNLELNIEEGIQIKKSEDGSLTKIGRSHVYALKEENASRVAIEFDSFRNYLCQLSTVSLCGSIPSDQVNIINDFIFTAGTVKIVQGHSTEEWEEAFIPRKQVQKSTKAKQSSKKHKKQQKEQVVKLPFINIEEMNLCIGLDASYNVAAVKDTTLTIKAFRGKEDTTSKEVINFYIKACLSRVPDFISNAEVLGLNIIDNTTGLWATWAGIGTLGSTLGAGAGVAAITGVDAVKGAIDAGKRRRNVSESADTKPGDFFRGLVQAAGEATKEGAAKRGKDGDGNIIDWAVGATSNTTDYAVENKNRLGGAAGKSAFVLFYMNWVCFI